MKIDLKAYASHAIPAAVIDKARRWPIESVIEGRGIKLRGPSRGERCGPCPVCGGTDRFSINVRKQVFLCRRYTNKGDVIALVQFLDGSDFREAVEMLAGEKAGATRPSSTPNKPDPRAAHDEEAERLRKIGDAMSLWAASLDPRGTLVERYLNSRKLELDCDVAGEVLRWHPDGAMIALFRNIHTNEPQAVSRTYLGRDARKLGRKFLGPVGGAAIKLDADDTVLAGLHVGEGVETCITAAQVFNLRPAWALGSSGAVAGFPILSGVECITLFKEKDCDASKRAVETCAQRWSDAGKEVIINTPLIGKDLNDAIRCGNER